MKKMIVYLIFAVCFGSLAFVDYHIVKNIEVPKFLTYTFCISVLLVMIASLKFDKKVLS